MKHTILGFCGIKVAKITEFAIVKNAMPEKREKWINRVKELGSRI